ncbi:hypothetical protein HS088_TW21G00353 [Tripterygium wilfordii]|uniref:Nucleolar pre-ribosomal-associated protein 1 n=1 Tax=Tripterygium wilfordii TaxID=458696 RepID=A0A7J7C272_TRIWF|nr:uncharacterized protein LOC119989535 [Tripterygium wilfordii]KAF5728208.1 hypothetical protein HS088_TW21G00353 [Tripterygium wilfordii]
MDDDYSSEYEADEAGEAGDKVPNNSVPKVSLDAKLKELLHKINSIEIKLCSDGAKEFIKLLNDETGGELLRLYVQSSSGFMELLQAWKLREGKPGMSYVLSLVSTILSHPEGIYRSNDKEIIQVSRVIDKFARVIVEEKMELVCKELRSKDGKCQKAALLLLASIVRRGSGLASEVAKKFDFNLWGFSKLAECKKKRSETIRKHSTRKSFVGFAMSFLEVGKPGLLRSILQQREMYFGVLRGLGDDDNETIIYVLSTLRDTVLTEESLVPPGLRSVLFGRVTLERLISISGRGDGEVAAEVAHSVLLMVCTDPCNGLMPDLKKLPNPLRGNTKRLLELMKKLKAAEIGRHRDLLLSIIRGGPYFGSAYMEEFPYNLEDFASPTWFAVVSLAAEVVSALGKGLPFGFLNSCSYDLVSLNGADAQTLRNCIAPCPCNRSVINKGLLHADFLVNHGTLRLLMEMLKLLDSFIKGVSCCSLDKNEMQSWATSMQDILNEVQTFLPDPQVLLTLFKRRRFENISTTKTKMTTSCLKRAVDLKNFSEQSSQRKKKLKVNEDVDIKVGGIDSDPDNSSPEDSERVVDADVTDDIESGKDFMNFISEIWGLNLHQMPIIEEKDTYICFYSKLLDALQIYLRIIPTSLEGSFDFFMNLLGDPLTLPVCMQRSILSLLIEYTNGSPRDGFLIPTPPHMYKHLSSFINLLIFSPTATSDIKDKAYDLALAAMSSTGAFDSNLLEVGAWLLFLPGHSRDESFDEAGAEVPRNSPVSSFLCDAVSTIGNNLFRYWDVVRHHSYHVKGFEDVSPDFSPMVICVLEKCLRLLNSKSGNYELPDKSMISSYVCSTLKYLLQTQVDARPLSALIESFLSKGPKDLEEDAVDAFCEWRPLKNLFLFSRSILYQQAPCFISSDKKTMSAKSSFANVLSEVKRSLDNGLSSKLAGIAKAFAFTMSCTTPDEILEDFPAVLTVVRNLQGVSISLLSIIFFMEPNFLADVSKLWPEMFHCALEMAISMSHHDGGKDDATGKTGHCLFAGDRVGTADSDVCESAASAFSFFLRLVPFHVLLPSVICTDGQHLLLPKVQDLLLAKISECPPDCLISYLRLVLFWLNQIQLSYRREPLSEFIQTCDTCFTLIKHLLAQLLAVKPDIEYSKNARFPLSVENSCEVAETIFSHPAVIASLAYPLGCNKEFTDGSLGDSLETFLIVSRQTVHILDHHVLDTLTIACGYMFNQFNVQHLILKYDSSKRLVKTFNGMVQQLLLGFRDKFDLCIRTEDLSPLLSLFYTLYALIRFMSPFKLLELAHWMFGRVDKNELTLQNSYKTSALSFGVIIACNALGNLCSYLQQPAKGRQPYNLFWEMEEKKDFDVELIDNVYAEVCKFFMQSELGFADTCLLKVVKAVYGLKYLQHCDLHPLSLVISRTIMRTPLDMLSHMVYKPSMTKASIVFYLTKMSPLHLSVFGHLLLHSNKGFLSKCNMLEETHHHSLSDEEFMIILPAALSYLKSVFVRYEKQYHRHFSNIPTCYSRILLHGFLQWKLFVSKSIFHEEYGDFLPSSAEELLHLVSHSLLGKAIQMLQYHSALTGDSIKMKKRLKLFNSMFPKSVPVDDLLDCNVGEINFNSVDQALNLINKVVAKISFCMILLFPEENQTQSLKNEADGDSKEISLELVDRKVDSSKLRFLDILATIWRWLVRKFPFVSDDLKKGIHCDCLRFYHYLENFILRSMCQLTAKMCDQLNSLQSLVFLDDLMKSFLLHRFDDLTTLKMLHGILAVLSEGKFSRVPYIQILLSHSQFAPTIQSVPKPSSSQTGVYLRPMPSIFRSLVFPHASPNTIDRKNDLKTSELYMKQLEIIKLLKVLLQSQPRQSGFELGKDSGINFRELHFLLLSSYGATLSEIDLEIYEVLCELESIDRACSENIAEMDYLWGVAARKVREQQVLEQDTSSKVMDDAESVREHRRSQFRENLPIDPKVCAATVLYFPYDRTACHEPSSLRKLQQNDTKDSSLAQSLDFDCIERYDPVFILRLSIHSLSAGYIEVAEFASLGLLAVAFVSMSSPYVGMRKLGYEALGRLNEALEKSQKKKDVGRLRLLSKYVQNGIEEPWQRIPSVITVFAAEASVQLLDPSHDHYATLSKILMNSSKMNMKCIPLFDKFFLSSSVNYKTERLWILRLTYAGLNIDDDAPIYVRNSVFKNLQSFYASPLSDSESKELILQAVKKSVKLHTMAYYLVEHCALFSWLSSVVSFPGRMLLGDEKGFFLMRLALAVEIAGEVVSSRNIADWLQKYALEQLMELSSHLYNFLVGCMKLIEENVFLVHSILKIIVTTLKISQKRKMFQPHFTLSLEGLFQIYQAVSPSDVGQSGLDPDFGLRAILMSTPSIAILQMNYEKLSSFVMWTISAALKSDSEQRFKPKGYHNRDTIILWKAFEESLTSKLLRWLIASVILGKLFRKRDVLDPEFPNISKLKTLKNLLEHFGKVHGENGSRFDCEEILAAAIFYLQQLVGRQCAVLPSVVSTLGLLLFDVSKCAELLPGNEDSAALLLSRIHCPAEANPAWRWSFYQPWKDHSSELSESQKMDELHASQSILARISNYIGKKSIDLEGLRFEDMEKYGAFKWERSLIDSK